jgi:hypothetical protein
LPDISVFWIIAPAAVIVEIFVAGHVSRHVLAAAGPVFALVARLRPPAKIVGRLNIGDVIAQLIGAREGAFLPFIQAIRISGAGDFSFATIDSGDRLIAVLIGVHAKGTGAIYVESQVRRIDFKGVIAVETANAEIKWAEREPELRDVIAQIKESHAGFRAQTDGCGPDLNFGARIFIDP